MSSSYYVEFTAHVDESRRPEGFPRQVHIKDVYENVESVLHLQALVNDRFMRLIEAPGLVILKNEDEPLEQNKITFDKRVFVSWGILTHMTLDVKHIPNPATPRDPLLSIAVEPEQKPKEIVN